MPSDRYDGWVQPRQEGLVERSKQHARLMQHHRMPGQFMDRPAESTRSTAGLDVHATAGGDPPSWLVNGGRNGTENRTGRDDAPATLPESSRMVSNVGAREADGGLPELRRPPEPGTHPSFDAKVAAEFLRLRATAAGEDDRGTPRVRNREGGAPQSALLRYPDDPANSATAGGGFESDVESAMRDFEQSLAVSKNQLNSTGTGAAAEGPTGSFSRRLLPRQPGPTGQVDGVGSLLGNSAPFLSDHSAAGARKQQHHEEATGILSQMDLRRGIPGGGKGKSGGLRDMWGGGWEENEERGLESSEMAHRRRRPGGGLGDMWQGNQRPEVLGNDEGIGNGPRSGDGAPRYTQRQGLGLKGMWHGEDSEEAGSRNPQRQGPGLRGLWCGPEEIATEDAARIDAKAAYLRALDHDAQQRRTAIAPSNVERPPLPETARLYGEKNPPPSRPLGMSEMYGATGTKCSDGTSLAGIGATPTVAGTPHRRLEMNDDERDRRANKAKKAAYAEELRRQIAEKEEREAAEKRALADSSGGRSGSYLRRRASTGGGRTYTDFPGGGGGYGAPAVYPRDRGVDHDPGSPWDINPAGGLASERTRRSGHHHHAASPIVGPGRDTSPQSQLSAHAAHSSGDSSSRGVFSPHSGGSGNIPVKDESHRYTAARRRLVEDVYGGGGMGAALGGSGYRRASTGSRSVSNAASPTGGSGIVQGVNQLGIGSVGAVDEGTSEHLRTGAGVQSLSGQSGTEESKWLKRAAALEQQRALQEQISEKARAKKEEEDRRRREDEEEARQQREWQRRTEAEAEEQRRRKQAEQQEQLQGLYRQQEAALRKRRGGAGGDANSSNNRSSFDRGITIDGEASQIRAPAYGGAPFPDVHNRGFSQATTYSSAASARDTPRRRSTGADIDDLPAGVQARAEMLCGSPLSISNGGRDQSATSPSWLPASTDRLPRELLSPPKEGLRVPPPATASFDDQTRSEVDVSAGLHSDRRGNMAEKHVGGGGRSGGEREGRRGPALRDYVTAGRESYVPPKFEEPPLHTSSSLLPVSSDSLFPTDAAESSLAPGHGYGNNSRALSGSSTAWNHGPRGMAISGRVSRDEASAAAAGLRRLRQETIAGHKSSLPSAAPDQDEMDAFVTSWQMEHLRRRRGSQGSRVATAVSGSAVSARPTFSTSPSRDSSGISPPRSSTEGRDGGWGAPRQLQGSLAATSRMMDLPLPNPPASGGNGGSGRRRRPGTWRDDKDELQDGPEASECSLTSDSMLFYLTGQQQEETTSGVPGSDVNGETTSEMFPRARDMARLRARKWGDGGEVGSSASQVGAPAESLSVAVGAGELGHGSGGGEQPMSPLTRLLAATDVRLEKGSGSGGVHGSLIGPASRNGSRWPGGRDPPDADNMLAELQERNRLSAGSATTSEQVLGTGGGNGSQEPPRKFENRVPTNDSAMPTVLVRNGEGLTKASSPLRASEDVNLYTPAPADALPVAGRPSGGFRRTRALWGSSTGVNTLAEGLALKSGGVPWEEMPEARESFSSQVLL